MVSIFEIKRKFSANLNIKTIKSKKQIVQINANQINEFHTVIFHITKNPSTPKAYEKLIQCCKYFFAKNPVLIIHCLKFDDKIGWTFCSKKSCHNYNYFKLSIKNLSSIIWITKRLQSISSSDPSTAIKELIPKVFRCDAWILSLDKQIISCDALSAVSRNVKKCTLMHNEFEDNATFEKVITMFPKLQSIFCWQSFNNHINVKELIKILNVKKLNKITLLEMLENFDIEIFYEYIKFTRLMEARLSYQQQLPDDYKNKLNRIIDEIINTKNLNYCPPNIEFLEMQDMKRKALKRICSKYYDKNLSSNIVVPPAVPVRKVVNRCQMCNKRVGLIGFDCRRGKIFCGEHRYDFVHNCTFDYKTAELEELRKDLMGNWQ